MEVYRDIEQGSAEWFAVRCGIPTASEFHKVMAKTGPRGGTSHKEYVERAGYMRVLAGEIITGEPSEPEWSGNRHTERGKEREDEARDLYAFMTGTTPERVGFVKNGNCGCSPDSFVDDGGLEIKDVLPHRQIENLEGGALPSKYRWQVIGALLVAEDRAWWDFMSHCRGLPPFVYRVWRDKVGAELDELRAGIDRFNDELALLVKRVEAMW